MASREQFKLPALLLKGLNGLFVVVGFAAVGCASKQVSRADNILRPVPFLASTNFNNCADESPGLVTELADEAWGSDVVQTSHLDPVGKSAQPLTIPAVGVQATKSDTRQVIGPANTSAEGQGVAPKTQHVASTPSGEEPVPATAAPEEMTVEHFVMIALSSHPKIQAAQHRVSAARNRIAQVSSLADPTLSDTFWPFNGNALQTAGGRAANQLTLTQAVPWPEKLRARAAIANREVQIAVAEAESTKREIAEAVKLACVEIAYNSAAIRTLEETDQVLRQLAEVAQTQYGGGGSRQRLLRVELEADKIMQQQVRLFEQREIAIADLAALIHQPVANIPQLAAESAFVETTATLDELIALAELQNPELQGLAWEVARDRQKQRLACLQRFPDFQLGMNWLMVTQDDAISPVANGNDNFGFTVGLTLPVWRDRIDAGIREAGHQTASSSRLLDAERDLVRAKLRRLVAQADSLLERREIFKTRIIPRTEDIFSLAKVDYAGNRTDFATLVETYRDLLVIELQLVRVEATLAGVVAQIERVSGAYASAAKVEREGQANEQ